MTLINKGNKQRLAAAAEIIMLTNRVITTHEATSTIKPDSY